MLRVRTSRRAAGLRPTDYDHEIVLVDHDGSSRSRTQEAQEVDIARVSTESRLLPSVGEADESGADEGRASDQNRSEYQEQDMRVQERPAQELEQEQELPHAALRPSIEVQGQFT